MISRKVNLGSLMNYRVGAWPCARPVEGDHKGTPLQPHNSSKNLNLLVLLAGAALTLVLAACSSASEAQTPSLGDRLIVTEGSFDNLPLTAAEAEEAGWIDTGECVPNMGRHFLQMMGEQPGPVALLYNPAGDLIGVELESLSEQSAPPWEHLGDEGHPGMEFEHWTIHFWFDDPANACAA